MSQAVMARKQRIGSHLQRDEMKRCKVEINNAHVNNWLVVVRHREGFRANERQGHQKLWDTTPRTGGTRTNLAFAPSPVSIVQQQSRPPKLRFVN